MSEQNRINQLEKRLINTERTLISLWALLEDTVPDSHADKINIMMERFFKANVALGSIYK